MAPSETMHTPRASIWRPGMTVSIVSVSRARVSENASESCSPEPRLEKFNRAPLG